MRLSTKPFHASTLHTNRSFSRQPRPNGCVVTHRGCSTSTTRRHTMQVQTMQDASVETCVQIMRIPTGLGMWRSRAEALGWPQQLPMDDDITYDVLAEGWGVLQPSLAKWGRFKVGHALPNTTATGMNAVLTAIADTLDWPHAMPLTKAAVQSAQAVNVCVYRGCLVCVNVVLYVEDVLCISRMSCVCVGCRVYIEGMRRLAPTP